MTEKPNTRRVVEAKNAPAWIAYYKAVQAAKARKAANAATGIIEDEVRLGGSRPRVQHRPKYDSD